MEIFKRTKISRPTIYKFLNGEKIRARFQIRIYSTALKIIERDKIQTGKIKKRTLQDFKQRLQWRVNTKHEQ